MNGKFEKMIKAEAKMMEKLKVQPPILTEFVLFTLSMFVFMCSLYNIGAII